MLLLPTLCPSSQLRAQLDLLLQQQAEKEAALTNGDFDEGDQDLTNWMNDFDQQVGGLTSSASTPTPVTWSTPHRLPLLLHVYRVEVSYSLFMLLSEPFLRQPFCSALSLYPSGCSRTQMAQLRRQAQDMERQVDAKGRLAAELKEQHTQVNGWVCGCGCGCGCGCVGVW
jgi:hypothetical protein